jgi:hypothetical protein
VVTGFCVGVGPCLSAGQGAGLDSGMGVLIGAGVGLVSSAHITIAPDTCCGIGLGLGGDSGVDAVVRSFVSADVDAGAGICSHMGVRVQGIGSCVSLRVGLGTGLGVGTDGVSHPGVGPVTGCSACSGAGGGVTTSVGSGAGTCAELTGTRIGPLAGVLVGVGSVLCSGPDAGVFGLVVGSESDAGPATSTLCPVGAFWVTPGGAPGAPPAGHKGQPDPGVPWIG